MNGGQRHGLAGLRRRAGPPLLVGAAVAGPLMNGTAVTRGPGGDIDTLARVDGLDQIGACADRLEPPLLVGAAVAAVLLELNPVLQRPARYVQALAGVHRHQANRRDRRRRGWRWGCWRHHVEGYGLAVAQLTAGSGDGERVAPGLR